MVLPLAALSPTHLEPVETTAVTSVHPIDNLQQRRSSDKLESKVGDTLESADVVMAKHTATKLHHGLTRSFMVQSFATGLPLAIVDLFVTATSLIGVSYLVNLAQGLPLNPGVWRQLPAMLMLQLGLISLHQLYPGAGISPVHELRGIVRSTILAVLFLSGMNLIFGELPRIEFVSFACTGLVVAATLPIARYLARHWLSRTSWWGVRTVLIGLQHDCERLRSRMMSRSSSGLVIVGSVDVSESVANNPTISDVRSSIENPGDHRETDEACRVASLKNAPVVAIASRSCVDLAGRLVFQFPMLISVGDSVSCEDENPLFEIYTTRSSMPFLRLIPRLCKRTLDLVICIPALIVLAIPMAIIAIAIKRKSPGPVFYGPERIGQHGKTYRCWKFRSMFVDANKMLQEKLESDPVARAEWDRDTKLKDDPRVIPGVGNLIRRWSLDELPQLWNVFLGQMSLIGPRPIADYEVVRYQKHYYEYTQMLPGITGLWQVSGRNDTSYETRVFLVHSYAANWSLWLDAWILIKTPVIVLTRRGAY
ncbi:exopolysaccharide biosynthesis polyprenyl glycosylphosphotransferase [Rubripirellula tenax]|uniref:exopolysaccharide biosynthesis polyprenyl glycosylphosphotransferase n=1 Tax=Rubripirellula tenax TaxID=2528015 RepID=UPI0016475CF1|nr:exopolysaccharide biosynthesis polyprenyl glycosylphosphotransferase [Rubripirellula tenax]